MAHWMKWLLGAVVALVAVPLLISSVEWNMWPDATPADVRRQYDLATEVRRAEARMREAVYLDSLMPLLPAQPGVRVVLAPFVASDVAASIHEAAAQQLAQIGLPQARTGVFVVPATLGGYDRVRDVASAASPRYVYFAGVDERSPYCFAVAAAHAPIDSTLAAHPGLRVTQDSLAEPLGPCFYWARYGAPGPRMQQWLRTSGYRFAELRVVPGAARIIRPARLRLFGRRDRSGASLFGDACLNGNRQACARALLAPDYTGWNRQLPPDALPVYDRMMYHPAIFGAEMALLASLEASFGSARFAQFWRSDDPVEVAFANAFGVPLGEWVYQWARRYAPEVTPVRATLDTSTVLLSLLALAALSAAAVSTARRREVS